MDLSELVRPRRLVIATLILLLTGSAGLLGVASANDPETGDVPVLIPLPRQGDQGLYEHVTVPDETVSVRYPDTIAFPPQLAFRVGEDAVAPNGTGAYHTVNSWSQWAPLGAPYHSNFTLEVVAGTNVVASSSYTQNGTHTYAPRPFPYDALPSEAYQVYEVDGRWFPDKPLHQRLICFRSELQGAFVVAGQELQDAFACGGQGREGPLRVVINATFEDAQGVGVTAFVFDGDFDLPEARLSFRTGIAYPTEIAYPAHGQGGGRWEVFRLTHFGAGHTPIATEDLGAGPRVPQLQYAVRQLSPFVYGEIPHPFPLEDALADAMRDGDLGAKEFLADHPDAYLAWVRGGTTEWDDAEGAQWHYLLTDGDAWMSIRSTYSAQAARGLLPNVGAPGAPVVDHQEVDPNPPFSHDGNWSDALLAPHELPDVYPTLASLIAQWEAYQEPTQDAPVIVDFMLVRDPDGEGGAPGLFLQVGQQHAVFARGATYPVFGDGTWNQTSNLLEWRDTFDGVAGAGSSQTVTEEVWLGQSPAKQQSAPARAATWLPVAAGTLVLGWEEAAAVSVGAILLAAAYLFWPYLKFAPVALFSRVRREKLLENSVRAQIVDAIAAEPGIHQEQLMRTLQKGRGALDHHLQKLVAAGLITRKASKGYVCYFVPGQVDRHTMAAAPALRSATAKGLVTLVQRRPGLSLSEAAGEMGLRPSALHYHVEKLVDAGVLTSLRDGRAKRLHLGPHAVAA